jgi:phospholipase C
MRRLPFLLLLSLAACGPKHVVSEATAAAARSACTWKAGAMTPETLASDAPTGEGIPIDHVVLIIQENHSFDNVFSQLGNGAKVAAPDATNSHADGTAVARFHLTHPCTDEVDHSWNGSLLEYDSGMNDGFVRVNDPSGERAMGYYDATDLAFYYALAQTFAISDSHFCSVLGPTVPNRVFSLAGTAFGITVTGNQIPPQTDPTGKPYPNIFTELDDANVSWSYYTDNSMPEGAIFIETFINDIAHYKKFSDFATDAAAGTLPSFSIVEPKSTNYGDDPDEHPPADVQVGQAWTASVVHSLMTSPNWPRAALFFTYDEHGGYYDSVPPPPACAPDDIPAQLETGEVPASYDRYGFRVPLLVVSPYARRGHVSHHITDHTSILRFIEARFDLPAMTARDANADPLFDMFDFGHRDTSVPSLPDATIDMDGYTYCTQRSPDPNAQ